MISAALMKPGESSRSQRIYFAAPRVERGYIPLKMETKK